MTGEIHDNLDKISKNYGFYCYLIVGISHRLNAYNIAIKNGIIVI
jgi:hypothetical protein